MILTFTPKDIESLRAEELTIEQAIRRRFPHSLLWQAEEIYFKDENGQFTLLKGACENRLVAPPFSPLLRPRGENSVEVMDELAKANKPPPEAEKQGLWARLAEAIKWTEKNRANKGKLPPKVQPPFVAPQEPDGAKQKLDMGKILAAVDAPKPQVMPPPEAPQLPHFETVEPVEPPVARLVPHKSDPFRFVKES